MNYYNDNSPEVCAWLRELIAHELIPTGFVDQRSILDVRCDDEAKYHQRHFFAGIAGWSLALQLSGWPDNRPVWTGSCPCQPISCSGKRKGHADERHLWPAFYRLISECHPPVVFGEQVASKDGEEWLCAVRADLEGIGYAVGAARLLAGAVGAPHKRPRFFWVASDTDMFQFNRRVGTEQMRRIRNTETTLQDLYPEGNIWTSEPKPMALAHGIPGRVGLLRGYGNAIVPQVAAEFIRSFLEATSV